MDNGVDLVLRDQRGHAGLISDVADDERGALRYRPIETGRVRKLNYSEIGSEASVLASGAFQSGSKTSTIPGSS